MRGPPVVVLVAPLAGARPPGGNEDVVDVDRDGVLALCCRACAGSGVLRLGTVRISGGRDGDGDGVGIELSVNERLAVNSRDVEAEASPILRRVVIVLVCTACRHSTEVVLAEDATAVLLSVSEPA